MIVQGDGKREFRRIVVHQVGRPTRHVSTAGNSVEIDQWQVALHDLPEAGIIPVVWIRAAIAISQQATLLKFIVIGAGLALDDGRRFDSQRQIENLRLEDPLWRDQRNALALEQKSFDKSLRGQHLTMQLDLGFKKAERLQSNLMVDVHRAHIGHVAQENSQTPRASTL